MLSLLIFSPIILLIKIIFFIASFRFSLLFDVLPTLIVSPLAISTSFFRHFAMPIRRFAMSFSLLIDYFDTC